MIDPVTTQRALYWGLFCAIAVIVMFVRILPLDLSAGRWPGPDWIMALAFAWVLRRPDFMPVLLLATVLFLSDIMFMRPPGLVAAIGVIGLEFLRGRALFSRDLPFLFEWAMVAGVLLAMMLAKRLILGILVVGQPSFALDSLLLVATVLVYPLVVLVSALVMGVHKVAPGAVDQLGHRI
jgi:rod shape-determining protein MreD